MGEEDQSPKTPRVTRYGGPGPGSYMLPPTIGYEHHDPSRLRNPAYSIGAKAVGMKRWSGPGPQYDPGNVTRFGPNRTPHYKLGIKPAPLTPFKGPGPGAYAPEKCPPTYRAPAFSMGGRTHRKQKDDSPGPNAYVLPPFKTYPNPVIGARPKDASRFQSPGPAAYSAPPMDIYKPKTPRATVTGRNDGGGRKNPGPGPGAYMSNYRQKNPPKFSFGVRHTEIQTPCVTEEDNK